jgi:uncharacterized protein (DUF433 family)
MPISKHHPRISIDADICAGAPRITGTRIPVALLLEKMAAGASTEWLLEGYPQLTRADLEAALAFAAASVEAAGLQAAE